MSRNAKTSAASVTLILLGIFALLAGAKSLAVLIPAAILVWYRALPALRSGRN